MELKIKGKFMPNIAFSFSLKLKKTQKLSKTPEL